MNRRSMLQLLSALPLLWWLKPEPVDAGVPYCGPIDVHKWIVTVTPMTLDELEATGRYDPAAIEKLRIPYYRAYKCVIRDGVPMNVSWCPGVEDEPF